jgi:hypothetical protein
VQADRQQPRGRGAGLKVIALFTSLFALTVATAEQSYPTAAVLNAFSAVCRPSTDMAQLIDGARKLGWSTFQPASDSPMARGISMIGAPLAGGGADPEAVATYRLTVDGRPLELLLVQYDASAPGFSCEVDDFGANQPIDAGELAAWAGRSALPSSDKPPAVNDPLLPADKMPVVAEWRPGVQGAQRTLASFTPPGSFFNQGGMIGISLMSQWDASRKPR